jgi:hypothetical protein
MLSTARRKPNKPPLSERYFVKRSNSELPGVLVIIKDIIQGERSEPDPLLFSELSLALVLPKID